MFPNWSNIHLLILELEQKGLVTRTFRRLDPDRQLAIMQAILDEASDRGPADINIKQIAERAGVSVGSLYTYFNNRDGLLQFAIALCVHSMTTAFDEILPYIEPLSLHTALEQYLLGGIEWSQMQTGLVQFFARAAYHGDAELGEQVVRPVALKVRAVIAAILQQAAARGEIRPMVDLEAATRLINALLIAVVDSQLLPYLNTYFQVYDEQVTPERIHAALLDLIEHGLRPSTGTSADINPS